MQSAQRDQTTGEIVDKLASLSETAQADNLRALTFAHMCQTGNIAQDEAALRADLPPNLKFKTLIDRIEHMWNPLSMIGEREVKATAEVVGGNIHVIIEGHSSRSKVMYRVSSNACYCSCIYLIIKSFKRFIYPVSISVVAPPRFEPV